MNTQLKIENISCGYPGKFMLKDISFEIKKGSFTGIIGPNGSGKTTLFRGITGEIPIIAGKIYYRGKRLENFTNKQRAQNFAIVTQKIEIPNITVEEYVLMGRFPYKKPFQFLETKKDYSLAEKYMKMTGVYQYKDKLFSELSGGEQQLISIAKALTQEPEILLLDEPTSHLDIAHQVRILNLLQNLNQDYNLTVIMIIHDLNLAGEYCDNIIMMSDGKIHISGTANEVLNYKYIEEVYKTPVVTRENPISKKPAIFLISERVLKKDVSISPKT